MKTRLTVDPASDSAAGPQRVVVNIYGGLVQDVFCSDPHARTVIVDWDNEGRDLSEDGIVEVQMEDGGKTLAYVADYPTQPLKNLPGTDVEKALTAAKLAEDWFAPSKPEASSDSDILAMCRQVAETAQNWADCSDMKEALAVFKELGQKCRAVVDRYSPRHITRRYILYDFDAGDLATTNVYDDYREAADDASELDNVIVMPLVFEKEADEDPCECEKSGYFCSGVPGILAHMESGRLAAGAKVECCDLCQRYPTDEAALERLQELGHGPP